jgi:hypothetical protein
LEPVLLQTKLDSISSIRQQNCSKTAPGSFPVCREENTLLKMTAHVDSSFSDVIEDGADGGTAHTLHRLRANSSIMQMKKILGMLISCISVVTKLFELRRR